MNIRIKILIISEKNKEEEKTPDMTGVKMSSFY